MKITVIEATTLPDAWNQCLRAVRSDGFKYVIDKGSFQGQQRQELDHVLVHVKFPGAMPVIPIVPEGVPAPVTMEYVESYLPYLLEDVVAKSETYTYGQDIKKQYQEVIRLYKEYGSGCNQACMSIGNAESIKLEHSQCLRVIDTRVRYGALHFEVYFRSWDLWGGFPANLAGIEWLKQYMASEIGVENGEIIANSKGLHLYDHCWELADEVLGRK